MRRYGGLYDQICDFDNLALAHHNARRGKTSYRDVQVVDTDPKLYLNQIHDMLINKTYVTSPYVRFTKNDGKKDREIFVLPYYPDRIIQWAVVQILEPIWMRTLIRNTYSSLKGRGIHQAMQDIHRDMQDGRATKYCLKIDIKKFYPSINHDLLKAILRKKIKDPDVLTLLDGIIDSTDGIPIGNYLSQFFGNLYLSCLDHWAKEILGVRYYYRYCDDIVILHSNKEALHEIFTKVQKYLKDWLSLTIKSNYQIFPTRIRGIDFVGYRFFGNYILLRKSTVKSMKYKLLKIKKMDTITKQDLSIIASYAGWIKWCDGTRLTKKYIKPLKDKYVIP